MLLLLPYLTNFALAPHQTTCHRVHAIHPAFSDDLWRLAVVINATTAAAVLTLAIVNIDVRAIAMAPYAPRAFRRATTHRFLRDGGAAALPTDRLTGLAAHGLHDSRDVLLRVDLVA